MSDWIKYDGTNKPDGDREVEVKLRRGGIGTGLVRVHYWYCRGDVIRDGDIESFRYLDEPEPEQPAEDGGWIKYDGTNKPFNDHIVEVKLYNGVEIARDTCTFHWHPVGIIPIDDSIEYFRYVNDKAEDPGWIDWEGGPRPVSHDTLVEIEYRDGTELGPFKATHFEWSHGSGRARECEVIRYRVVEEEATGVIDEVDSISPEVFSGMPYYVRPGLPEEAKAALGISTGDDTPSALDTQVGGSHYKDCRIQPVEFIEANSLPFLEGCIVKRITRHMHPDGKGREDIEKIMHECQLILELRYGEE